MGLYLQDLGLEFTPIFIETGWEHSATYEYMNDVLAPAFGEFITIKNEKYFDTSSEFKGGFEQMCAKKKMFPSSRVRFCTSELKVIPIQNFYSTVRIETKLKPVCAIGIRASESQARANKKLIDEQDEATIWHPLLHHTENQVIDLHHDHSMPPNPLYLKGSDRVGCYPCIYARKSEIRHMSYNDAERIDYMRELEQRINALRPSDKPQSTFFYKKPHGNLDINEAVMWARSNGGKHYDDSESVELDGCMRWGLCESPQRGLFDHIKK
jgi:3'-phosphoadenosine 5'-phosphosulfate sulfotransferase (PAPS reductase)/FAD synthetase